MIAAVDCTLRVTGLKKPDYPHNKKNSDNNFFEASCASVCVPTLTIAAAELVAHIIIILVRIHSDTSSDICTLFYYIILSRICGNNFWTAKRNYVRICSTFNFLSARKSSQHLLLVLLPPCTLQGCQKTRTALRETKMMIAGFFRIYFRFSSFLKGRA